MKFSERVGAAKRIIQKDSMDEALKNGLWNIFFVVFLKAHTDWARARTDDVLEGKLLIALWMHHFSLPLDKLSNSFNSAATQIRDLYMRSPWEGVYDFVEYVANSADAQAKVGPFTKQCNKTLEKHLSAYRFVGTTLAPITSEEEIAAIEQGLAHSGQFAPVAMHLETALQRLADKPTPDARNSIKESISAVEAACQIVTGGSKATLGQALKTIGVHPAMEKSFSALYGYTSDSSGIRHALLEESTVDADDARFFLVSCSAFTNYLIAKSAA